MSRLILFAFVLTLCISGCDKKCNHDNSSCEHDPSEAGYCTAYFERWFYNASQNKCEEISYSGCTELGFATKTECENCGCN